HDKRLAWGARASAYAGEIASCLGAGRTPVLVELEDDVGVGDAGVVVVDHHGPRAAHEAPTSLHQVFALLGLASRCWTRRYDLVAANDRGAVRALVAAGATRAEIEEIRAADRA